MVAGLDSFRSIKDEINTVPQLFAESKTQLLSNVHDINILFQFDFIAIRPFSKVASKAAVHWLMRRSSARLHKFRRPIPVGLLMKIKLTRDAYIHLEQFVKTNRRETSCKESI